MTESMRSRGMRDMLPEEMERFRRIEDAFRRVCTGWGFAEVRTPTIEQLYLFTSAGTLSPQMLERVYSFLDWDGWSGERVVLRPDSTIPSARLFHEQLADRETARLFYVQNVFRFEPDEASREDWQCGVELIGSPQPQGDVQLVLMAHEALAALGVSPVVKLSDPGILRALLEAAGLETAEQLAAYDRILDGDLAALDEVQKRLPGVSVSLRALLAVEGSGPEYLANLSGALAGAVPAVAEAIAELAAISAILGEIGIAHSISPALVRNFEYYTGPVYHFYVDGTKVGGGGRYDALLSLVGGRDLPASGFALEVEPLMALLPAAPASARTVAIECDAADEAQLRAALALARGLRDADCGVEFAPAVSASGGQASQPDRGRGGTNPPPPRQVDEPDPHKIGARVSVAGGVFRLSVNGGAAKELRSVEDVVAAVSGRAG